MLLFPAYLHSFLRVRKAARMSRALGVLLDEAIALEDVAMIQSIHQANDEFGRMLGRESHRRSRDIRLARLRAQIRS